MSWHSAPPLLCLADELAHVALGVSHNPGCASAPASDLVGPRFPCAQPPVLMCGLREATHMVRRALLAGGPGAWVWALAEAGKPPQEGRG